MTKKPASKPDEATVDTPIKTPQLGDPPQKWGDGIKQSDVKSWLKGINVNNPTKWQMRKAHHEMRLERAPVGRDVSFTASTAPRQIVYGRCRVPGYIIMLSTHDVSDTKDLYHAIVVAGHQIDTFDTLFLDGNTITFSGHLSNGPTINGKNYFGLVQIYSDTLAPAAAITALQNDLPTYWTAQCLAQGCAFVYLKLMWGDGTTFGDGQPAIEFQLDGKPVYDPRTGRTQFYDGIMTRFPGRNAALVLADYLMDKTYGYEAATSEIDMSLNPGGLQWAANICDELVPTLSGTDERRYTIDGYFDTSHAPSDIKQEMEMAMAGFTVFTGGIWKFWPGHWGDSANITLTEDDLRDSPKVETLIAQASSYNSVRGTYIASDKNFEETDFPAFSSDTYVAADSGVVRWKDFKLPFTTSAPMAQRIVKIELENIRRSITITCSWSLKAFPLEVGDVCYVTLARYGWSSKTFRVDDWAVEINNNMEPVVHLLLREIDSSVYSWNPTLNEQAVHRSLQTTLPNSSQATNPTGLTLASGTQYLDIRADGTIFSRIYCSWTQTTDNFVIGGGKVQVQYKKSGDSTWRDYAFLPGNSSNCYILDVQDSTPYDVQIRNVNALGVANQNFLQVLGYTVIGKTEPPPQVQGFSAALDNSSIALAWTPLSQVAIPDLKLYEIRLGTVWETAAPIGQTKASTYRLPFQAGSFSYLIKAVDTSGNYSLNATAATLTLTLPGVISTIKGSQIDNNVLLSWTAPAAGSLPIAKYRIYKGATFGASVLLGETAGTAFMFMEQAGGSFIYWVSAVDAIGNESTASQVALVVANPPDFVLQYDQILNLTGNLTHTNVAVDASGASLVAPALIGQAWGTYFSSRSWGTMATMNAAGYHYLTEPTPASATFEQTIDLLATLPGSTILATWNQTDILAGVTCQITLSYKQNSGDAWTDGAAGASQVYATNFRYVKVKIVFSASTDKMLQKIDTLRVRVSVKKQTDSGTVIVTATGGTKVYFTMPFLSVVSMSYGLQSGSSAVYAAHDVIGSAPTYFWLHLYDKTGAETTGTCTWTAQGIVNVIS